MINTMEELFQALEARGMNVAGMRRCYEIYKRDAEAEGRNLFTGEMYGYLNGFLWGMEMTGNLEMRERWRLEDMLRGMMEKEKKQR